MLRRVIVTLTMALMLGGTFAAPAAADECPPELCPPPQECTGPGLCDPGDPWVWE